MRFMLPESPRWLVQKGRLAEADRIVSGIEESIRRSGKTLPPPNIAAVASAAPQRTRWLEIFEGIYLKRTLSDWAFWFCCFSTTYGLLTWLPTLYRTVFHLSVSDALKYGMITSLSGIVSALACAFFIDLIGRRVWFTAAFLIGGFTLLALWQHGADSAETILTFVTFGMFFMSSLSLSLNLYTSEIYPTRIRAFGGAVGGAWQRVAAALGPNVIAWLLPYGTGYAVPLFRRARADRRRAVVLLRHRDEGQDAGRAVAVTGIRSDPSPHIVIAGLVPAIHGPAEQVRG